MARYETISERGNLPDGSTVWAYAFSENGLKDGMRLKQTPIKGRIVNRPDARSEFIPFKKGSNVAYARSKAVHIDSRNYADTEAEAAEGYNELVNKQIEWYKKKITALENERI